MKRPDAKAPDRTLAYPRLFLAVGLTGLLLHCAEPPDRDSRAVSAGGNPSASADAGVGPTASGTASIPGTNPVVGAANPSDPGASATAPAGGSTDAAVTIADPGIEGDGDFEIGPTYLVAPEAKAQSGITKGALKDFTMSSTDSKIYKGDDAYLKEKASFTRKGTLYLPANYVPGTELPFMVVGDGSWSVHRGLMSVVLDNLIAAKKVPAMAVVFIDPGPLGGGDGPGSQRSFEYDNVTDTFVNFIETEVLPKMTADYNVKFTTDPEGRGTMGGSSSGNMAFTMAWLRPDLYHRVLTYSGTFTNRIQTAEHPQGAWEYHQSIIPAAEKKPLRVTIHASENDLNFGPDNDWQAANRAMAKIFKEKGYHYRFQFAKAAGHIDSKVYNQTLPENLIWLWRGYPIK